MSRTGYQRQRFSAWLGIFAILMLFIAPMVSITLAAAQNADSAARLPNIDTDDSAMSDYHAPPSRSHHASVSMEAMNHSDIMMPMSNHAPMMNHAACDYCLLLIHLPLLNATDKPDIRSVTLLAATLPVLFVSEPIITKDVYSELQPRAPPAFYS
ncbi:DUF2946 domain-containing protein [Yersinia nurmii]|uniref:DUF2946 domain-containing protein n=2 Tax=Yersinia nurmii TaxID=685706 RepID=A0AAW7JVQ2_9GAMM|nr:DUF2946 domain-containing protein [Yersinia nurmii]MDN0086758.1 DUF2946 domain-containing protein [Yersinia nurmii]